MMHNSGIIYNNSESPCMYIHSQNDALISQTTCMSCMQLLLPEQRSTPDPCLLLLSTNKYTMFWINSYIYSLSPSWFLPFSKRKKWIIKVLSLCYYNERNKIYCLPIIPMIVITVNVCTSHVWGVNHCQVSPLRWPYYFGRGWLGSLSARAKNPHNYAITTTQ